MSFLKAEWRKLAIANYAIDPQVLTPYLPGGTELDMFEGKCYVSLVGFMFVNTRILGVRVPFHANFEEVNLRFYVKRIEDGVWKRGVVFIKEIVPKHALTFVANTIYKEHYETLPMKHLWDDDGENLKVKYEWKKNGKWQKFAIVSNAIPEDIVPHSETEFITEHYWGYAKVNELTTNEYEVTHPKWRHYPVKRHLMEVDYRAVYGEEFAFLNAMEPNSVMLAEGSEITVESKRSIKDFSL